MVAVLTDITFYSVILLCELKESKKEHADPSVYLVNYARNWPKIMKCWVEYLRVHIGIKGFPLSYVVITK